MKAVLAALVITCWSIASPAMACSETSDCQIESGEYRIHLPENAGAQSPVIIFLHGWQATAQGFMNSKKLRGAVAELGAVLVTPQGIGKTWSYPGAPRQLRDEFAFFDDLRADLTARHGLSPERMIVAGFSMGGSMVWNLACHAGSDFGAFLSFSGAFWDPIPTQCEDPARILMHVHGTSDTVVPFAGRQIREWRQSDVGDSFAAFLGSLDGAIEKSQCSALETCTSWRGEARTYQLRLHSGGHIWRGDWLVDIVNTIGPNLLSEKL